MPSVGAPKKKLSPIMILIPIVVIVGCLIGAYFLFFKRETVDATVTGVEWERSIIVEAYGEVTYEGWWDDIPNDAEIVGCWDKYRYTSEDPEPNSTEVCSEEEVEDTGTGLGEVVVYCTYEVYDQYCEYTVMAWQEVRTVTESGDDLDPFWPDVNLTSDERTATETEEYRITFDTAKRDYSYSTDDLGLFLQAVPGSAWELEVNNAGGVLELQPSY